jgi:hypothetical protein
MYCPKCAAQNAEDAKFCRVCGADVSLVPQAMSGELPENRAVGYDAAGRPYDAHGRRVQSDPPTLHKGLTSLFMGIGFIIVSFGALFFSGGGRNWWFWMLIPAFWLIGSGIAQLIHIKHQQKSLPTMQSQTVGAFSDAKRSSEIPRRSTSELIAPPPSVTEGTTRLLDEEGTKQRPGSPVERN